LRVNAEDVTGGIFRPSPGTLTRLDVPARAGVRFDTGYEAGDEVQPYYDSLIGKLIVWAPTRQHAIDRTLECLRDTVVTGIPTTLPAAAVILNHPDFRAAAMTTRWLEERLDLTTLVDDRAAAGPDDAFEPTADEDADGVEDRDEVWVAGRRHPVLRALTPAAMPAAMSGAASEISPAATSRRVRGRTAAGRPTKLDIRRGSGTVTSPMQGTVVKVAVIAGQQVAQGEVVVVMEAMKMENPIRAAVAGTVASVAVSVGQVVPAGTVLAELTPEMTEV
jgi:acetyl-CoA/propionyl-CoA carboxylase biotin carboxyl carrier protein